MKIILIALAATLAACGQAVAPAASSTPIVNHVYQIGRYPNDFVIVTKKSLATIKAEFAATDAIIKATTTVVEIPAIPKGDVVIPTCPNDGSTPDLTETSYYLPVFPDGTPNTTFAC